MTVLHEIASRIASASGRRHYDGVACGRWTFPADAVEAVLHGRTSAEQIRDLLCMVEVLWHLAMDEADTTAVDLAPGASPQQRRILSALARRPGQIVSSEALLSWVYFPAEPPDGAGDALLAVQICKLRPHLTDGHRIERVRSTGYRLVRG